MDQLTIFTEALQITAPWFIKNIRFTKEHTSEPTLYIDIAYNHDKYLHANGSEYPIIQQDKLIERYHNFFSHTCYLHITLPSYKKLDMSVEQAALPIRKNPPIHNF